MKLRWNHLPLIVWIGYWLVASIAGVHDQRPILTQPDEYGWSLPIAVMSIILLSALCGWLASGKDGN